MKKLFLVLAIAAAVGLPANPIFSQQKEGSPAMERHGMMGEDMHHGSMMCPMMGMGGHGNDGRHGPWRPRDDGADDADEG